MLDNLSKEIIKRILADVGAAPGFVGTKGLTDANFTLLKQIPVAYSDGTHHHNVYAGKLEFQNRSLRGLVVDLTIEDDHEHLFVFQLDSLPIHVLRLVHQPDHLDTDCYVKIQSKDGSWKVPDVITISMMLVQFEKFVSYGLLWKECKEVSDLFEVAVKLINKE